MQNGSHTSYSYNNYKHKIHLATANLLFHMYAVALKVYITVFKSHLYNLTIHI